MKKEIKLPNLGDGVDSGSVVSIEAEQGDKLSSGDTLIEIETDKAVTPFPTEEDGTVVEIKVSEGDDVSEGDTIAVIETESDSGSEDEQQDSKDEDKEKEEDSKKEGDSEESEPDEEDEDTESKEKKKGDSESDKKRSEPKDKEKEESKSDEKKGKDKKESADEDDDKSEKTEQKDKKDKDTDSSKRKGGDKSTGDPTRAEVYAGPAARAYARELGVNLKEVKGSNRGERIDIDDIKRHVKQINQARKEGGDHGCAPRSLPDFSNFGKTKRDKLSGLRKSISGRLSRTWRTVPHVHQFQEVDFTTVSELKSRFHDEFKERGSGLTPSAFLIKALARCLEEFPRFNASLDEESMEVVLKQYIDIGIAVDTPAGLLVPVLRNANRLSVFEIGEQLRELAEKARDRKLNAEDMSGSSMSISNLGSLGTGPFTPVLNWPEVAILGVPKAEVKPVWNGEEFVPRETANLCLAYDHRVIDGADGARFIIRLKEMIEDFDRLLLGG